MVQAGGAPAHVQIEQWLTDLIAKRQLLAGDKLPNEKSMAAALAVSRMTLRQALSSLEGRGVVQRIPGRSGGTFIVEPTIDCDITGLAGFTEQLWRGQVRASARVVSATTVSAPRDVARALGIDVAAPVHEVVRVRALRREPVALECSCLPAALFPDLLEHSLRGSLYHLLRRQYALAPYASTEYLEPLLAGAEQARLLGIAERSPLMRIERTAFSVAGQPVEFARDVFRPERIRIVVRTAAGPSTTLRTLLPRES